MHKKGNHIPYMTNSTGIGSMLVYANSITHDWYGTVLTAIFAATLFFMMGANDRALMLAGFGGMLMSMFMNILGIISSFYIMIYVGIFLVGLVWNWTSNF